MSRALVLGKFAPLHAGHQLLIDTAVRETDQVVVMIYDAPQTTTVPLSVRAGWIRCLYNDVEVIEAWDGPVDIGDTAELRATHERYILDKLGERGISHFYSSEFYGAHISAALGAVDRRIDPDRELKAISASMIRGDPYAYRHYLDPLVYRDLISRIVFLGAPSTGKTTLARELSQRHDTVWMPEYGREYWLAHQQDRRLSAQQLVDIARGHLQREDTLLNDAREFLFVDTEAITTYLYAVDYHGEAAAELQRLADEAEKRYDLYFLCADDIPYDNTWERSGLMHRTVFQKQIRAELIRRRVPFMTLNGDVAQRVATVERLLHDFDRYAPLGDSLIAQQRLE